MSVEKHLLKKEGKPIVPLTTSDAVVDLPSGKALSAVMATKSEVAAVAQQSAQKLSDAPNDGERYVRCAGEWVTAGSDPGLTMDLFINFWNCACGASGGFNEESGYFELNGLTDITYAQAMEIYAHANASNGFPEGFVVSSSSTARSNIPPQGLASGAELKSSFCNSNIEVISFAAGEGVAELSFDGCMKGLNNLKRIEGVFNPVSIVDCGFANLPMLESLYISGLSCDLDLRGSKHLERDSLVYMINHAPGEVKIFLYTDVDVLCSLSSDEMLQATDKKVILMC